MQRRHLTGRACRGPLVALVVLTALSAGFGCARIRVTDPPRTATEQFLLSVAASRAVSQLTFEPLRGRAAYIDTRFFAASEQPFVVGEMRAKMLLAGIRLVDDRADAQVVVEVRSGGVGIDRSDFLLGVPSVVLSADAADVAGVPIATPELALLKNLQQQGIASVAYVAYWADSGEILAHEGPALGRTMRDDWWFFGVGPRTVGDIPTIGEAIPTVDAEVEPEVESIEPPLGAPDAPASPDEPASADAASAREPR